MTSVFRILTALTIFFIVYACNQDPTSVPSKLIPDEDKVEFLKYDSYELDLQQNSSSFEKLENLFGADTRILGKNDYAKSSILLSWEVYLADTMKDYISNGSVTIKSSTVSMRKKFSLGDKTKHFDFSVGKILGNWNVYSFNRDSLKNLPISNVNLASNISYNDTTVNFNLNSGVVLDWLKYQIDSTSAEKNYGIILSPTSNTEYFQGFKATYQFSDEPQTTITIVFEKPNSYLDTVVVYPNRDLHVVENLTHTSIPEDRIYLQAGYAYRGLTYFDLSALPKEIAVTKAILELTVDTLATTDGNPASDSLFVNLVDSLKDNPTYDSLYSSLLTRKGKVFSGDVSWMVQKWNSGTKNNGMMFTLYDEFSSVSRIILYGSKENNKMLRPRLTIYYPKKI